jgi:hypothetical protein
LADVRRGFLGREFSGQLSESDMVVLVVHPMHHRSVGIGTRQRRIGVPLSRQPTA